MPTREFIANDSMILTHIYYPNTAVSQKTFGLRTLCFKKILSVPDSEIPFKPLVANEDELCLSIG
jgi:hypothetical protein